MSLTNSTLCIQNVTAGDLGKCQKALFQTIRKRVPGVTLPANFEHILQALEGGVFFPHHRDSEHRMIPLPALLCYLEKLLRLVEKYAADYVSGFSNFVPVTIPAIDCPSVVVPPSEPYQELLRRFGSTAGLQFSLNATEPHELIKHCNSRGALDKLEKVCQIFGTNPAWLLRVVTNCDRKWHQAEDVFVGNAAIEELRKKGAPNAIPEELLGIHKKVEIAPLKVVRRQNGDVDIFVPVFEDASTDIVKIDPTAGAVGEPWEAFLCLPTGQHPHLAYYKDKSNATTQSGLCVRMHIELWRGGPPAESDFNVRWIAGSGFMKSNACAARCTVSLEPYFPFQ